MVGGLGVEGGPYELGIELEIRRLCRILPIELLETVVEIDKYGAREREERGEDEEDQEHREPAYRRHGASSPARLGRGRRGLEGRYIGVESWAAL